MKIPKKIKIGNLIYRIEDLSEADEDDYFGRSYCFKQYIKLSKQLTQECKEETLFHELVHLILEQGGFKEESKDEKLTTTIGNGFYQVLKDNKLLK